MSPVSEASPAGSAPWSLGRLGDLDDVELIRRFEARTIVQADWTHTEHCRVGYIYLCSLDWASAVHRMRRGIMRLNIAQGVPNSTMRGYHETITIAWLRLIAAALERGPRGRRSLDFLMCNPALLCAKTLSRYFSAQLLEDSRSRRHFTPADRRPLP